MKQIRDFNSKRVCDLSDVRKIVFIRWGDSVTLITAEKEAKLIATVLRQAKEK